jgi:hypothetical protein
MSGSTVVENIDTIKGIYCCSLLDFLNKVEDFVLDYEEKEHLDSVRKSVIFLYATIDAEIYFLKKHIEKLMSTRDTNRNWIEETYPTYLKVQEKLLSKTEKLSKYRRELPLPKSEEELAAEEKKKVRRHV